MVFSVRSVVADRLFGLELRAPFELTVLVRGSCSSSLFSGTFSLIGLPQAVLLDILVVLVELGGSKRSFFRPFLSSAALLKRPPGERHASEEGSIPSSSHHITCGPTPRAISFTMSESQDITV